MKANSTIKYFLLVSSLLIFSFYCLSKKTIATVDIAVKEDSIVHYNLIIAPDLSNRIKQTLYPKSVSDQDIIKLIFNNIGEYLRIGRQTHQKDIYRIDFINKKQISLYGINADNLEINFFDFGDDQLNRIDFITGVNKEQNLIKSQLALIDEVNLTYSKGLQQPVGADIWTYMNTGFNESMLGQKLNPINIPERNKHFINAYRNILIMLTDGYIETLSNGKCIGNNCNELTQEMVNNFRNAYEKYLKNNPGESFEAFFEKKGYGITPVNNPSLRETEVLVIELYDRSLTKAGIATAQPTDYEILKLFWNDWLVKSQVKYHKIYPAASSIHDVKKAIDQFVDNN